MTKTTSNRQRHNQFSRGRGVFACEGCGRNTRGTSDNLDAKSCAECYELCGYELMFTDYGPEEFTPANIAEVEHLLREVVSHGGSRTKVVADDAYGMYAWIARQPPADAPTPAPATTKGGTLLNLCYNARGDVTLYVNGKKVMKGTEAEAKIAGNGYGDGRWGVVYDNRK